MQEEMRQNNVYPLFWHVLEPYYAKVDVDLLRQVAQPWHDVEGSSW